jgi:hypothetical protein
MDLPLTLALAAGTLVACLFFGWRGMRPADPLRGPRLIPHRFLMMLSAAVLLLLAVHLANLAGMTTG